MNQNQNNFPTQSNQIEEADPLAETQMIDLYGRMAEARQNPVVKPFGPKPTRRKTPLGCCLLFILIPLIVLASVASVYIIGPGRTNILLIGIDARPKEGNLGRTDTMILTTFQPLRPYVGMLSIPRDLWVKVPGYGENRINTAHFFAEAAQAGSGPEAAMEIVRQNFGVNVDYYVRLHFNGFTDIVDSLGGVDVTLPTDMSGYSAGTYHLDGKEALALARDRETSDDFYRMGRGQLVIKSILKEIINPAKWVRLPTVFLATTQAVDTNVPVWQWPRLAFAIFRVGPTGMDTRIVSREMVNPFITTGGADVLAPNWAAINPVIKEMFGQ
jgi:polyisoprenyl-teichoic acid--peptidoglycan teichoic acid transferase